MKKFSVFITLILILFKNPAFAEEEKEELNGRSASGNLSIFFGYNNKRYIASNERDANSYLGLNGLFSFQDLSFFGNEDKNKFGLNGEFELNSFNSSNPFQIKEINFLISAEEMGTRIFGFQKPITSKLKLNSSTFSGVSGGVNGKWQNFIRYPFLSSTTNLTQETSSYFITKADMPLESGITSKQFLKSSETGEAFQSFEGEGESNIGISYVSARSKGFRFGLSYFPDSRTDMRLQKSNIEDEKGFQIQNQVTDTYLKNIFATGFNFYENFNDFEVAFSGLYEHAGVVSEGFERADLNSYSFGLNLGYLGFMFGGSFTNYGSSLKIQKNRTTDLFEPINGSNSIYDKNGNQIDVNYNFVYDVGIGYNIDKYTINLSYIQSRFAGSYFWAGAFSFETKVTKNLFNYFQIARYQFSPANQFPVPENKPNKLNKLAVLIGIQYKI